MNSISKKSNLKAAVAIAVALTFLMPGAIVFADESDTIVSIQPSTQMVEGGETFNVSIYVEPSEPIMGNSVDFLFFDPTLIQANSVTFNDFFDPYTVMRLDFTIDNINGEIRDITELIIGANNVSTKGTWVTISFTAQQKGGTSTLVLDGVIVSNAAGKEIPVTINNGEVTVIGECFYTLDISVDGSGTTDPIPGTHTYSEGTIVDLEAIHDLGWSFDYWDGDVADPNSAITNITMDVNKIVTAYFTEDHYILTVSTVGDGVVDVVPDKEFYLYGEEPQLTAVADTDWTFDHWGGDLSGNTNPTTIFMDGNKDVIATFTTEEDTIPPVTEIILDGTMGNNGWYVSVVTVTLVATDEGSGVESTYYRVYDLYWKLYAEPFEVSKEGYRTVEAYSFDWAGNREYPKVAEFKIDTKPPVTTHKFDGVIGKEGWFAGDVTVILNATDAISGVNYTKYKLDSGEWTNYTAPFDVTENGEYSLCYYSVDLAGNTEPTNDVDFKIKHDTMPPVTMHEFDGIIGDNGWFISNVVVTLTAVDDSAGVDYTMYKVDDGEWIRYVDFFVIIEDGEHTLYYYSVDKVENKEDDKGPFDFKIDQTMPTIVLDAEGSGSTWLLTATVSDETSGIAKVDFYVNGKLLGEVTSKPYEWEYTGARMGEIAQAIAFDKAGNLKISNEEKSQSQDPDAFIGWTFLIGWISNVEDAGDIITAQAIRLRYIEVAPTGITIGFVKMKAVEFSSYNLLAGTLRSFGKMSMVIGIFKGEIIIEDE